MCSENKGADQLRGYREADLRLCFRICKNPVFLCSFTVENLMLIYFRTPINFTVNTLKIQTERFCHGVIPPNDANGIANS